MTRELGSGTAQVPSKKSALGPLPPAFVTKTSMNVSVVVLNLRIQPGVLPKLGREGGEE